IGRPLHPPVPAVALVGAVLVVLAVRLVVFALVADQVVQREPVVGRDEVDAGVRPSPPGGVEIARTGQTVRQLGYLARIPPPEPPDGAAIPPVPFGPPDGEVPNLVAAGADVPWLGDELDLRQEGVLLDDVEERAKATDLVQLPGQGGG